MSSINSIIGGSRGLGDLSKASSPSSAGGSSASSALSKAGGQDRALMEELSKG